MLMNHRENDTTQENEGKQVQQELEEQLRAFGDTMSDAFAHGFEGRGMDIGDRAFDVGKAAVHAANYGISEAGKAMRQARDSYYQSQRQSHANGGTAEQYAGMPQWARNFFASRPELTPVEKLRKCAKERYSSGVALLAVGIIGLCRCDSRQRKLIWEQMGDLFRSETEQAFGPDTKLPELVIDEADIHRSQMIDRHWEEFQIKNYRQGVHQGVRFGAANVELTHNFEEHVGRDVNDTMTRSVKAFGGVWLICETERQAPEGGYLYRREDDTYGRDALELVPLLETLGRPAAVRWEENRLELALESTLPVMDLPVDINVRDLNALRRSYLVSLRYLQGIIEALRRCGALFAEHEKEQTNG